MEVRKVNLPKLNINNLKLWLKQSYTNNKSEWKWLLTIGFFLVILNISTPLELLKRIFEWIFIAIGADLIYFKRKKEENKNGMAKI